MSLRFYCLHHFCHGNHHPFNNQHARISNHLSFSRSAYCKENLKKKKEKKILLLKMCHLSNLFLNVVKL